MEREGAQLLVLLTRIKRIGLQSTLHALMRVIYPVLDVRGRQIIQQAGLSRCRLALNDLNDER